MISEQTPTLRSRRLQYFDADLQRTRTRLFNSIEIAHADKVFEKVEQVLYENGYDIKNKYVSISKCGCLKHDDTRFIVEITEDIFPVELVRDIDEGLEELEVKFTDIIAIRDGRRLVLGLMFILIFPTFSDNHL
ncbi:MAG: hypothetical protein WA364_11965 [Candidatus Nitrosopolaris sp.]